MIWNTTTGEVQNLREFLPAGSTFATGTAINDNGQIAGDFRYADGTRGAFILTPAVLAGDATFDGDVNIADFAILASNFNLANADWGVADFNADGITDIADFAQVAANFNHTVTGRAVVPEPGALIGGALAAALVLRLRGRR